MIDFLKIMVTDRRIINNLNSNLDLFWVNSREQLSHYDQETINTKETKESNGILFCFHDNRLEILLRPHYLFNHNLHNANSFTSNQCIDVLKKFLSQYGLDEPEKLIPLNIEFGVNIEVPIDIKDFIRYICYHGRNEFRTDSRHLHSKKSSTFYKGTQNQYKIIKAYAKSIQFPLHTEGKEVFRFEVKSKRTRYIQSQGINSIADLLQPETYLILGQNLIKEYQSVLILDQDLNLEPLDTKERGIVQAFSNPLQWDKFLSMTRNTFHNNKKRYYDILDKTGYNLISESRRIIRDEVKAMNCAVSPLLI